MKKSGYADTAIYALKALGKNFAVYIPDAVYYAMTAILALLFLYLNNLTVIFSGLSLFKEQLKSIVNSSSLIFRFVLTLIIFVVINLLMGLGTISLRYSLVKTIIEDGKLDFRKASKHARKFVMSVLGIKVLLLFIHLVPLLVFGFIAVVYVRLASIMTLLIIIIWVAFRFIFLFLYPVLFLNNHVGPIAAIKKTINYTKENVRRTILTGLLILVFGLIISSLTNSITSTLSSFGIAYLIVLALIAQGLIVITFILWSSIFLFKSY